ncbi:hypothetical protein CRM22_007890, partial [Opisthorchis felineus]
NHLSYQRYCTGGCPTHVGFLINVFPNVSDLFTFYSLSVLDSSHCETLERLPILNNQASCTCAGSVLLICSLSCSESPYLLQKILTELFNSSADSVSCSLQLDASIVLSSHLPSD